MVSLRASVVTIVKAEKARATLIGGLSWLNWLDAAYRPAHERAWHPLVAGGAEAKRDEGVSVLPPGSQATWS